VWFSPDATHRGSISARGEVAVPHAAANGAATALPIARTNNTVLHLELPALPALPPDVLARVMAAANAAALNAITAATGAPTPANGVASSADTPVVAASAAAAPTGSRDRHAGDTLDRSPYSANSAISASGVHPSVSAAATSVSGAPHSSLSAAPAFLDASAIDRRIQRAAANGVADHITGGAAFVLDATAPIEFRE
jgi:hypothetical protein